MDNVDYGAKPVEQFGDFRLEILIFEKLEDVIGENRRIEGCRSRGD